MSDEKSDWKINDLEIHNFKSIKSLQIRPSRVNVFIGEPNAGKSNIIEALTLMGIDIYPNGAKLDKSRIRYTDTVSLFYDKNYDANISLSNGMDIYSLMKDNSNFKLVSQNIKDTVGHISGKSETIGYEEIVTLNNQGEFVKVYKTKLPSTFKYHFKEIPAIEGQTPNGNLNPDGNNLWKIVKHNSVLKNFITDFFKKSSFSILFKMNTDKFDIMRIIGDRYYEIDFSMTPDTFQRMLYYLAAIESNKNAVILFEEPEAQSYPPYVQMLAERIVDDRENQYFITTHSPFIVEKMLEHAGTSDDVKIFVTYYEDYQTKVHELTKEQIDQILEYNVDLFFNMEAYQK